MRGGGYWPGILATSAPVLALCASASLAGCNDVPACQREVFVAFAQTVIATDIDDFAPGVQTNVHVRTSLSVGDPVELEIRHPGGGLFDRVTRGVDRDGIAAFDYVTVPPPRAVLRATGNGQCGEASDEIAVDVTAGATCALALTPAPEPSAYYAPFAVLSSRGDPDPVTPGYQATIQIATRPGWTVELFVTTEGERSLGELAADGGGLARWPVTVMDGRVGFRATCRGQGVALASPTTTVVADTTPPSCEIIAPAPGATITTAWDLDRDLRDGIQLDVTGSSPDLDVDGEPGRLTITAGDAAVVFPTSAVAEGASHAAVTLAPVSSPATYDFALTLRDHAGNACMSVATYDVIY